MPEAFAPTTNTSMAVATMVVILGAILTTGFLWSE